MTSPDSYDQYADQLLNKVFQNVKKTASPLAVTLEDQLLNQLFQKNGFVNGLPSPPNHGNSNELFLIQQLKQQQMLIERQQQLLSPSPSVHQVPIQSITEDTHHAVIGGSPPVKKIPRVPVSVISEPVEVEEQTTQQSSDQPSQLSTQSAQLNQLKKKKSFIRLLSERTGKNKEFAAAAALATAAMKEKSIQQKFKNRKQEQAYARLQAQEHAKAKAEAQAQMDAEAQAVAQAEIQRQQQAKYIPQQKIKQKAKSAEVIKAKSYENPQPAIERKPSFWKPREEKPKGWWKGQRGQKNQQQDDEYEDMEVEEEEEKGDEKLALVPPKKTKKVAAKRVAPKKISSIKGAKPKRPMSFKPPPSRKNKVREKKSTDTETCNHAANAISPIQPMYIMPQQQMYQQQYYPQPMMMMPQHNGFYAMPTMTNMMGGGVFQQPQVANAVQEDKETATTVRRNKSIYNPRENTNDKCFIM